MLIDDFRKAMWEWFTIVLVTALIIFFATAPLHPWIERASATAWCALKAPPLSPDVVEVSFAPEARVPRTGSRGDGDYNRWRGRQTTDRR